MPKERRLSSLTPSADARPANAVRALLKRCKHEITPDHLFTVFAGQDKEATAKAREFFAPYPPSSPSIALLKDGELVHFIERHQIENRSAADIAADLTSAFDAFLPLRGDWMSLQEQIIQDLGVKPEIDPAARNSQTG